MVTNFLIRKMYLLPLEGVRGEEPSLGEGLGGPLGLLLHRKALRPNHLTIAEDGNLISSS